MAGDYPIRGNTTLVASPNYYDAKTQKQQGIIDGWYVDAGEYSPQDKWVFAAAQTTDVSPWPDGEHSCEAMGPHIQIRVGDDARAVLAPDG